MDCCAYTQDMNNRFDEAHARDEAQQYWKKGLDKSTRAMVEAVSAHGLAGASVLEVGGGIGGLHMELLERGSARAINVDVSAAYLAAAQRVAAQLGLRDRVEYRRADFVRDADNVLAADVVILHRVICCYPDMPALVATAAQHSNRLMVLSFPRDVWYMRLFEKVSNLGMWVKGSHFRFYVHPPTAILSAAMAVGLAPAPPTRSEPWQIVVFERIKEDSKHDN